MAGSANRPFFVPRRQLGHTGFVATALGIGDVADRPVQPQVQDSLDRLEVAHVDCFLFHGVSTVEGWQALAAHGGGLDQLEECLAKGLYRFRGISSHHPDVLRLAIESGRCDLVMFAVGPFCDPRYIDTILPLARARGVGTVCFKTFGAGKLLGDTEGYSRPLSVRPRGKLSSGGAVARPGGGGVPSGEPDLPHLSVEECVHYTLTVDPDVALLGLSFPNEQDAAFAAAVSFAPLAPPMIEEIRHRAAEAVKGKGPCWWNT
jgi:hypothetical protein